MVKLKPHRNALLLLLSAGIVCTLGGNSRVAAETPYRTGWRPPARALIASETLVIDRPLRLGAPLPSKVLNIDHLPVVRRQSLLNCGAFAPSYYYKTWQEAKERGWIRPDPDVNPERVMSPGYVYPLVNGGLDSGANPLETIRAMAIFGSATWADMPESGDYISWPSEAVMRKALPERAAKLRKPGCGAATALAAFIPAARISLA